MVVVTPSVQAAPAPNAALVGLSLRGPAAVVERVLLGAIAAVLAVLVPGAAAQLMERPACWSALFGASADL